MKRTTLIAATAASLVALGFAAAAFAHAGEGACPAGHEEHCGAAQGGGHSGHGMRGQGMNRHGESGHGMHGGTSLRGLDSLKVELKLTPAQQPVFEKYAALVKTQAEARKRMHEGMHTGTADHHAMHDTMRAYERQAAVELVAARKELTDALTPEQRTIVDRTLSDSRMAMGRGHRH